MPRPPQSLHIFRKDLIHLWPETLVVVLLFVAFAAFLPTNWQASPYASIVQLVSFLLHILMPISWMVLIARLIHDEPLVGDRQFWTSRPYHWANLLGAKVLYLLAFLYLPFLLMQMFLLRHVGLHPLTAIPGLLQNLLLITVIFILPIAAIASVTSTFTRLLLSVLAGLLYVLLAFGVAVWAIFERMRPPVLDSVILWLTLLCTAGALIYQYATRRTFISRILLLVTPVVVVLAAVILPSGIFISSSYSASAGVSDPQLGDFPQQMRPQAPSPGALVAFRNEAHVQIPFAVSSTDKDSAYRIRGVAATITAPGVKWSSSFTEPEQEQQISAGSPVVAVTLPIPLSVYNQIRATPADVHLVLATEHLKVDPVSTWNANARGFDVPGHGHCSFPGANVDQSDPICYYPIKAPEVNFATAKLASGSCSATPTGAGTVPAQARLTQQIGLPNLFDPVVSLPMIFQTGDPNKAHQYVLCAGTPVSFIGASHAGRVKFNVDVKQLVLENYALRIHPKAVTPE